jgi:hypothetical protein
VFCVRAPNSFIVFVCSDACGCLMTQKGSDM